MTGPTALSAINVDYIQHSVLLLTVILSDTKLDHMPGLVLLLSLTSVMELLHWSIIHKSKFVPVHTMEAYGEMKLQLCSFLPSALF